MIEVYTFFESTIWVAMLVSFIIFYNMYSSGNTVLKSILPSTVPILSIIVSIVLATTTSSIYPAQLSGFEMQILFLFLPLGFLIYYFFNDEEKRSRDQTFNQYTLVVTVLFVMFATVHLAPSPSTANDYFADVDEYQCSPSQMHELERRRNIFMIGCIDDISDWAYKRKYYICEIERPSIDKIYVIDNQFNEYLFDKNCKFKKKTGNYDFVVDE